MKNSLYLNIRNKAKQNRETGATPKKPTTEMLRQERKIKSKYDKGGPVGEDEFSFLERPLSMPMEGYNWENRPENHVKEPVRKTSYSKPKPKEKGKSNTISNTISNNNTSIQSPMLPKYLPKDLTGQELEDYLYRKAFEREGTPYNPGGISTSDQLQAIGEHFFNPKRVNSVGENLLEIIDPTGISSWDDASTSYNSKNPTSFESIANYGSVIPILGKIPKATKSILRGWNAINGAWDINKDNFAEGGYYPTQGPPKALFKGYANGGYVKQYATGSVVGEDDKNKNVVLRPVDYYNPETGAIKTVNTSDDRQTWINSDDPTQTIQHQLPEFEVIEEAPAWLKSDRKHPFLNNNPGLEYVPIEAALLPASLPFQATSRLGKAALFAAETQNPGFGINSAFNKLGSVAARGIQNAAEKLPTGAVRDNIYGVGRGIADIQGGRPFFETFPITKKQRLAVEASQDKAFNEGLDFVKKWNYANNGLRFRPEVKERIKNIYSGPLLNTNSLIKDNPIYTANNLLVNSKRSSLFKNDDISDEAKKYIASSRGRIGGTNMGGTNESITLRNHGLYYNEPQRIKDVAAHELGHSMQKFGTIYDNWGKSISKDDPDYLYRVANTDTPLGKIMGDAMVDPVKGKYTWEASPLEPHSELMVARMKAFDHYKSKGKNDEEIIQFLQNPNDRLADQLIKAGGLDRFFKPTTSQEVKRDIVRALPAVVPAVGIGAGALQQNNQSRQQATGGYTNPYNQYQDDPYLQYKVGGKVWQDIGAGAYGVLQGTLGTVTGGLTDPLMDMGEDALQKAANPNFDPNNPEDVKAMREINTVGAAGQIGGSILGLTVNPGNVGSAVAGAGKGANEIIQSSTASDSAKQWSQGISGVMQMGHSMNGMGSASSSGSTPGSSASGSGAGATAGAGTAGKGASSFGDVMTNFSGSKFGKSAKQAVPFVNQAAGMLGGNDGSLLEQGVARQNYLNSPEYLELQRQGNVVVNQGVNFSQGGNITNNSLNLRNTMRNKRFAKGGTFDQFGINFIPESAGLHHESANGGVPIGPNALAEGGEAKLQMADGSQYIVSGEVDGANTQSINGETMTQRLKKKLKPFMMGSLASNPKDKENVRRPFDSYSEPAITQAANTAVQETEAVRMQRGGALQYAANGGKLNKDIEKIVMEEYAAAYGGMLPNKYKGKVNMPGSYAKGGGIHIKPENKGKFTASAKAAGHSVQEHARAVLNDPNATPLQKKRANFARNAAKWNHADGGYVYNPMTQPMLAEGGPIYGDPASEYTYAMGGMYGDPYYRGGQIDYTNDMYSSYASGGPMVGNAPQAFKGPAGQNRGGMLMTYADGGMVSPEEQMMQEQQIQQQGGQEQMMQMVQQIAQAIMQGENPEKIMAELANSGMPAEQVQQIMQAAKQMAAQQQQQQPMQGQEQMMPPQGMMARGGRMRYDGGGTFGPITEAQAIANGYQPSFQDEIDYTQIPDVDNLYAPNNLNRLNPNIGGMLSEVFKTSPQTNYPPELPNNQLADLSKLPSQQYTPFYFDVNANPGDETTMPDGSTFDGNVYNTQTPTDHYYSNQDVLTGFSNKYPGDTTNTSNVNKNTDTPWFEEPWWSKASRPIQAIPGVIAGITGLINKKRRLDPELMGAQTVSYEPERIIDREESRRALDAGLRMQRNSAANARMLAGNTTNAVLNANKGLAGRIAESVMREANTNAQLAQQTGMTNAAAKNQFKQINEGMFQNAQTQALAGLQDSTSKLASSAMENRKQNLQEWIAKNRLGTRSYKTNINGQDVFVNADGQIYDAKTGTLLSAG